MWSDFLYVFCKMEFLCNNGDPNWLGMVVLVAVVAIILNVAGSALHKNR